MKKRKVIFIIRDGWGYRKEKSYNAILEAKTPNDDAFRKEYPSTLIKASGEAVGLPFGYQGNSEVGHMTIGSGRIIEQSLLKINKSIKKGSFFKKREFLEAIERCKKNNTFLHIIGLFQKEGVHSHLNHLFAILDLCKKKKFKKVYIHAITDGRDSPVEKGKLYIKEVIEKTKKIGFGEIVSLSGRYYAMDRDNRWDRTKKSYDAIIEGKSLEKFDNLLLEVKKCYASGITDEFITPRVRKDYKGIKDKDSVIFYNFRTDRPRQLVKSIIEKNFDKWERKRKDIFFVAMTNYYDKLKGEIVFKEDKIKNILGEILSLNNIKQLRISETEKYAHVTFFFNGQEEKRFKGERRILIPSPKVKTYDKKPEMSVYEISKILTEEIKKKKYQFILVNFVNADMVGHTGIKNKIIKAVEAVDYSVGKVVKEAFLNDYTVLISADHGNAEDQRKKWKTSHTINPVFFILLSKEKNLKNKLLKKEKGLKDIAPTILSLLGIKKPAEMKGESIIVD